MAIAFVGSAPFCGERAGKFGEGEDKMAGLATFLAPSGRTTKGGRTGYVDIGKRVRGEPKAAWPVLPLRGNREHWEMSG